MTTEEWLQRRGCTSKVPFASRREASHYAKMVTNRYGGGTVRPYSCPNCGKFHIGHNVRSSRLHTTKRRV